MRDDGFCVWQHGLTKANEYLTYLNSKEKRIQWTSETEDSIGSMPFLDMYITRRTEGFQIKVYRKPTHTNSYTKFNSNRPMKAQLDIIKGLLHQAYKLCSTPEDLKEEIELIANTFIANGYPPERVDQVIKSYNHQQKEESTIAEKSHNILCILYVKGVSDKLEKTP